MRKREREIEKGPFKSDGTWLELVTGECGNLVGGERNVGIGMNVRRIELLPILM